MLTYNDSRLILHRLCQIPTNCQCKWLLVSWSANKSFCKLFCVSWEVFVLHGLACVHWVAQSCTTTAYRWLSRFTFLTEDLVIRSWLITKMFRSGHDCTGASSARSPCDCHPQTEIAIPVFREVSKNVLFTRYHFCSRLQKVIHEKNWKCLDVLEHFHQPIHAWTLIANLAHLATHHSVIVRRHFFGFSISADLWNGSRRANDSSLALSLLLVAGISVWVTVSCDEDVGEVDEVEELFDKPGTTNGTWFDVSQWIFLPFWMRCGFWTLVLW